MQSACKSVLLLLWKSVQNLHKIQKKTLSTICKLHAQDLRFLAQNSGITTYDTARSRLRYGPSDRYQSISAASARASAKQLHIVASCWLSVDRAERWTDSTPLHRRSPLETGNVKNWVDITELWPHIFIVIFPYISTNHVLGNFNARQNFRLDLKYSRVTSLSQRQSQQLFSHAQWIQYVPWMQRWCFARAFLVQKVRPQFEIRQKNATSWSLPYSPPCFLRWCAFKLNLYLNECPQSGYGHSKGNWSVALCADIKSSAGRGWCSDSTFWNPNMLV